VIFMQIEMRDLARNAAEKGTPLPPRYFAPIRRWCIFGIPGFGSVMIILRSQSRSDERAPKHPFPWRLRPDRALCVRPSPLATIWRDWRGAEILSVATDECPRSRNARAFNGRFAVAAVAPSRFLLRAHV
jgi:hypothetical protein